jgi:hypothetical protein
MSPNAKRRRAAYVRQKIIATPKWANGKHSTWSIYKEAKRQRKMGRDVCVDHIVPLNSPLVCGLHTKDNLQILTVKENSKKSNYYWPDAPYTQLKLEGLMVTWNQLGLL